jgi:dihydrodipicolinate synthase/N-acetylneuraminate lyase
MNPSLQGVIPILATPFEEDGSVDHDSLLRLVDHLLEQGAHGLAVFGNAGEGYTLLSEERRDILRAVASHVKGRVPLCVGVGETGTRAAVEACRRAEAAGASALMVLPPYYLKPDGDGVRHFYESIDQAVTAPIMVQDAPLLTGVPLPPALLAQLEREIEGVRYAKVEAPPTAPKISRVVEASEGRLTLLGGLNGQFMIEEILRGSRGVMPASDMTSIYVEIWEQLEKGDPQAAWRDFTRALPLIRFELQPGLGLSAVKHNRVARGVSKPAQVRHTTRSLDRQGLTELAQLRDLVF